ncbi:hypothetical protein M0802_011551 [Mischocyttarus mexicanus]|nr:hypothetical protein M0802_011551 [Mischocyttarus mexicanus]
MDIQHWILKHCSVFSPRSPVRRVSRKEVQVSNHRFDGLPGTLLVFGFCVCGILGSQLSKVVDGGTWCIGIYDICVFDVCKEIPCDLLDMWNPTWSKIFVGFAKVTAHPARSRKELS